MDFLNKFGKLNACILVLAAFNLIIYDFIEIFNLGDYSLNEISNIVKLVVILLLILFALMISWRIKEDPLSLISFKGWVLINAVTLFVVSAYGALFTMAKVVTPLHCMLVGDAIVLVIVCVVWLEKFLSGYIPSVPDE